MLKPEFHDRAREAFHTDKPVKRLAAEFGTHYIKIRDFWNSEFGEEATKYRGKTSPAQFEALKPRLREEFESGGNLQDLAKELKISPKRIRDFWLEDFGESKVKARGKKVRKETGRKVGLAKKGCTYELKVQVHICDTCSNPFEKNQFSRATTCPSCIEIRDRHTVKKGVLKTTKCPVCGEEFGGAQGLATHFWHKRDDAAHREYSKAAEDRKWEGKVEGEDYVVCRVCGEKHTSLFTHLRVHNMTALEYREKYPGALIRCRKTYRRRIRSYYAQLDRHPTRGKRKILDCEGCGEKFEASKYLAPKMHLVLCNSCKEVKAEEERLEAEKQWVGKSEPEDYVTCQICGHKAVSLISHIRSEHPAQEGSYLERFPGHEIMAKSCESRSKEHWAKNYTREELLKYADEDGKVIVFDAEIALGCSWQTIHRYCKKHGLETRNNLAFQKSVLEHVKKALGGSEYEWEFTDSQIRSLRNPRYLYFFDGYFPAHKLIVEAHGKQHYQRVGHWQTEEDFKHLQKVDQYKRERALELGYTYLEISYDEPYTELRHLRKRLGDLRVSLGPATEIDSSEEELDFLEAIGVDG